MPAVADIPAWLNAATRELLELLLAGAEADFGSAASEVDDPPDAQTVPFGSEDLIDTTSAQARFGHPADTLRKWARETAGTEQAIGVRRGGRWLIDPRALRQRLNGK